MGSRSFLLGVGIGFIVSAGFIWAYSEPVSKSSQLTREELKAAADQLQLVLLSKEEYEQIKNKAKPGEQTVSASKPPSQPTQPSADETKSPVLSGKPQSPDQPKPAPAQSKPTVKAPRNPQAEAPSVTSPPFQSAPSSPESKTPAAPVSTEVITVRIPGATSATQTSRLLFEAGITASPEQLVDELRSQQKLDRIRAGSYQIAKGTSVEEIVKLLTTPPPQ